jgi:hypothetical protein
MSLTNTFETRTLQWLFDDAAVTRPTAWYIALFTAAPSDTGGGTEVSGGSYAREAVDFTISGDTASNSASIEFTAATASWGTVTHMAIMDASTSGNMIAYAALTASKDIGTGDILRFNAGDIDVTLD